MLKEAANPEGVAFVKGVASRVAFEFAQQVLAQHVERLAFCGLEDGVDPADAGRLGAALHGEGTKPRLVPRLFLSVVVDRQSRGLVDGSDVRLTRGREEPVVVLAVDAERLNFPRAVAVGVPGDVGLGVEVRWGVFPALVQGGQDVAVVAVPHPQIQAHGSRDVVVLHLGSQGACRDARGVLRGFAVADVQHRAQFVPVPRLKAPGTEFDAVDHVGVGERQALLLA